MIQQRRPPSVLTKLAVILVTMPITTALGQSPPPSPSPAAIASSSPYESWYEGFAVGPGTFSGALGLNYMNGLSSTTSANASAATTTTSGFGESLRISNSGFYIISPRLFTANTSIDLQLNQNKDGGTGGEATTQGKAIGYSFDGTFLAEKPYTAAVFANRNQIQTLQPSGGRVVGFNENSGAVFQLRQDSILNDWGYPWVEARLGIRQETNANTTTNFGHSQTSNEQSKELSFDASKGFETADLALSYQLNDRRNQQFSQSNFQSNSARLSYNLDFGPTLNRRLDSKFSYATRNGITPSTTVNNSERLQIDHYQNLSTDYQYGFNQQITGDATTTTQNGAFNVTHQLYKNLTTSAGISADQTTMPNGSTNSSGGQISQTYRHSLPGKGNFSANWSDSYKLSSSNLSSPNIGVIDEALTAGPILVGIPLDKHNSIVAASIKVLRGSDRQELCAAPGPCTLPGQTGFPDYEVKNDGSHFTIVILFSPLPLITPGDTLLVSYNYQVDPNLKFSTNSSGFGMGVDYRWISMSFAHRQSIQTPLSQRTSQFLQNSQQNLARLGLQGTLMKMEANANISFESYNATNTIYDQGKFSGGLIWVPRPDMRILFDVLASEAKYTLPDQHTTSLRSAHGSLNWSNMSVTAGVSATESKYTWPSQYKDSSISAQSSLNWFTEQGWTHSAALEWGSHETDLSPSETHMQVIGRSSITVGLLSLNASLGLGQWLSGSSRSTNRSFNISAVRQFR